ncbi:MAG: flagellar protein FlgN [Bacillota bacterium]
MSSKLSEIIDLLQQQRELYSRLLELATAKRELLVNADVKGIDEIVHQEQAILWQAGRLEDARFRRQMELSEELGLNVAELNFSQLKVLGGSDEEERLTGLQTGLVTILTELAETNRLNTELATQFLSYINLSMQAIAGPQPAAAYSPEGKNRQRQSQPALLDQKA